jgi:hypothetical protein
LATRPFTWDCHASLSSYNDIRFLFCPTQIGFHGKTLQGYKHWFGPAVLEAGVRNFTWYCLRHTFASRLAMAGGYPHYRRTNGPQKDSDDDALCPLGPAHNLAAIEQLVGSQKEATGTITADGITPAIVVAH